MRGLTHFILGAAAATFFASAMTGVQIGPSLVILVGAFFGLLPDTLDFKLMQYLETHHVEIDPNPEDPKPQEIADKLAGAINRAGELQPGQMVKVKLQTIRLDATWWRWYSLFYNTRKREVAVQIGPKTNIVGQQFLPGGDFPPEKALGTARFKPPLVDPYGKPSAIAGFSGPSFGFLKRRDGAVEVVFLPWHRRSCHSLTAAAFFALLGYLLASALGSQIPHVYALAIFIPFSLHVLIDSYGNMGCNLFWPFTKHRITGFGMLRAADPFWNFFAIYAAVMLILWNVNEYNINPLHRAFDVSLPVYFLGVVVLPWVAIGAAVLVYKTWFEKPEPEHPWSPKLERPYVDEDFGEEREFGEVELEIRERPLPRPIWFWRGLGLGLLVLTFVALAWLGPGL